MNPSKNSILATTHKKVTLSLFVCQEEAVAFLGLLCKCFILSVFPKSFSYSPDGVIAVVTKNGELMGYWEPGLHFCLPWTEA